MEFIRKSCAQVNDISELRIKTKGCGYDGCESTIEDALWQFSGPIIYYQFRGTHNTVDMTEGCGQHTDTKLTTLIFNGLAFVAQLYYKECKTLLGKPGSSKAKRRRTISTSRACGKGNLV